MGDRAQQESCTLMGMWSATASRVPDHAAFVYRDEQVSYAQCFEHTQRLARGLASLGLGTGDPVALVLPNTPSFVMSFFALAGLGAVVLPLNPRFREQELECYVRACDVRAVITDGPHAEMCEKIISRWAAPVRLIVTGEDLPAAGISFERLVRESTQATLPFRSSDEAVLFQYSSGSAGRPKRVIRTQQQCWWEAEDFVTTTQLTPSDRMFCVIPLFHAHGLGNCLLAAVHGGATLILMEDPHPFSARRQQVLERLERERATVFPGVPYLFHLLAEASGRADLSSLRLCFSAGSSLSRATCEAFEQRFGIPLRQLYGCTEAGSVTINLDPDPRATRDSVGRPMARVCVKVVDETGTELPVGVIGEIAIQSPAMTHGYFGLQELNEQVFRGGFFFTGDLGRLDSDGRLFITGRKTLFIEVRGNKVDPVEVERVLGAHPGVREAVVVGVKGRVDGEELVKAVVVRCAPCEARELIAFCQERLASFKVPHIVEFRHEISRDPLGKTLRKDLV